MGQALERVEYEEKLDNTLPDAPTKDPKPFGPDKEIRERLLKLKLFNQVWLVSKENDQANQHPDHWLPFIPTNKSVAEHVHVGDQGAEDAQHNMKAVDVPDVLTESDRNKFNDWYESELEKESQRTL